LFNFLIYSTQPTRRRSLHGSVHKTKKKSTGYETDKEDNENTLAVPHNEIIFESDEFGTDDEEPKPPRKDKEKKQVGISPESDDDRSFIEEEIKEIG